MGGFKRTLWLIKQKVIVPSTVYFPFSPLLNQVQLSSSNCCCYFYCYVHGIVSFVVSAGLPLETGADSQHFSTCDIFAHNMHMSPFTILNSLAVCTICVSDVMSYMLNAHKACGISNKVHVHTYWKKKVGKHATGHFFRLGTSSSCDWGKKAHLHTAPNCSSVRQWKQ